MDVEAWKKVESFLAENSISSIKRIGRFVLVNDVRVEKVNRLFGTKMEMFRHDVTNHVVHNSLKSHAIPLEISKHVRHIFGLSTSLHDALDMVSTRKFSTKDVPGLLADPNYLRARYDIDSECTGENVALLTVLKLIPNNYFSPTDLNTFNTLYGLPVVNVNLETSTSDSACWSDTNDCAENNLDIQYVVRITSLSSVIISPRISHRYASSTARYCSVHYAQLEEDRLNLATASRVEAFVSSVLNILDSSTSNRKRILSASYTIAASAIDPSARQELADMIQEATAQGTTFVVASGDDGAKQASGSCDFFDDTSLASPYAVVVGGTWCSS